jgi:non-specific serine/threonine protein kinase
MTGNLPADLSGFVGRAAERVAVGALLRRARLVTLTGVAGVGKTRLALRVAAEARQFPDGVWFADLSAVRDPSLLAEVVAECLGGQSAEKVIEGGRVLLVLDTCEHLVDACAELSEALLERCPRLRVLATSREPLDAPGEHVFAVPPMDDDAADLFAARAGAVLPGFALDDANRAEVARLCALLDGIPLAIELAAGRLRTLSVPEIAARVGDRFELLTRGRDDARRHRNLRTAIGWSHELCAPRERLLWARLSVFAGGFDRDVAEAVCADDALSPQDVFALISRLVEKSILLRDGSRYRLLDCVRAYGKDWLAGLGGEDVVRRRHRDVYLALARRAEAEWSGRGQWPWALRLKEESANLRAALDYCLATHPASALRLAASLGPLWYACGHHQEGRNYLDRAIARTAPATRYRGKALLLSVWLAVEDFDAPVARARLAECVPGSPAYEHMAGLAAFVGGDATAAARHFNAVLAADPDLDLGWPGACLTMAQIGICLAVAGDGRAASVLDECVRRCAATGDRWARSAALYGLALLEWERGRIGAAEARNAESLRIKRAFGDVPWAVLGIELAAWIAAATGRPERAARLLGALDRLWRSTERRVLDLPFWAAGHERCSAAASGFEAAFAEGCTFDLDETYAYALDDTPPDTGPELSPEELIAAELIAEGLTNRELAARLGAGERAADLLVERIMARLHVATRAQVAAWVGDRRALRL